MPAALSGRVRGRLIGARGWDGDNYHCHSSSGFSPQDSAAVSKAHLPRKPLGVGVGTHEELPFVKEAWETAGLAIPGLFFYLFERVTARKGGRGEERDLPSAGSIPKRLQLLGLDGPIWEPAAASGAPKWAARIPGTQAVFLLDWKLSSWDLNRHLSGMPASQAVSLPTLCHSTRPPSQGFQKHLGKLGS